MTARVVLALLLALPGAAQLPFQVDATQNASSEFPNAPRIQSFSFGQWEGRWVFVGGRIAGYHALGGTSADFPRAEANREVWVVDTTVKPARTYHAPVSELPASLACVKDEWQASGQLYFQDGAALYVGGGYGEDSAGHWVTYPILSKIELPKLIECVMKGHLDADGISYVSSETVQSAGGELVKLSDGFFYLVMGHVFTGSYTAFEGQGEHNSVPVSQSYLNEIRKLRISSNGGPLSVKLVDAFRNQSEFHRRDLNVVRVVCPKGIGLAVYGGVFTPDTQLSYSKPVYLMPGGEPAVDSTFDQKMNTYNTAKLLVYDSNSATMYTTFFGGISRFSWDGRTGSYVENARSGSKTEGNYLDGMQWSDQISIISRATSDGGKEETTESVQNTELGGFVGTDAVFIPLPETARASAETEILDLGPLKGKRTLVGYIYGGIRAYPFQFPYNKTAAPYTSGTVPTKPSDLILKVYVEARN